MDQAPQWISTGSNLVGMGFLTWYLVKYVIPKMREDAQAAAKACREERGEMLKVFREECAAQREHDTTNTMLLRDALQRRAH